MFVHAVYHMSIRQCICLKVNYFIRNIIDNVDNDVN